MWFEKEKRMHLKLDKVHLYKMPSAECSSVIFTCNRLSSNNAEKQSIEMQQNDRNLYLI